MEQVLWTVAGWAATSVIGAAVGSLVAAGRRRGGEGAAMRKGMRSLLRHELIELHRVYAAGPGGCPVVVKEHAAQVYEAYHALGGNGTATALYEEIRDCRIGNERQERA